MSDARSLFDYAGHYLNPPEAWLFAGAKYKAMHELRASAHDTRLGGIEHLNAELAGLDSLNWIDPWHRPARLARRISRRGSRPRSGLSDEGRP